MANPEHFKSIMTSMEIYYNRDISMEIGRMYWEDLQTFSDDELDAMVRAHRRDPDKGQFFPKTADLIAKATKGPRHLDSDAAWSVGVKSFDEKSTIVWTQEIAAARTAAMPIWNLGDHVGARMAFKAAYDAILARLAHDAIPKWQLSPGGDPALRLEAVQQAQAMGIISSQQAQKLLPHYLKTMPNEGRAIAGLLTGNVVDMPMNTERSRVFRDGIARLKAEMAKAESLKEQERGAGKQAEYLARKEQELAMAHEKLALRQAEAVAVALTESCSNVKATA